MPDLLASPSLLAGVLSPIMRLVDSGGPLIVVICLIAMLLFGLALERGLYWQLVHRPLQLLLQSTVIQRHSCNYSTRRLDKQEHCYRARRFLEHWTLRTSSS